MSDQSDFNDEILKDKLEILLDEDNDIKKWNEGLLIKSLIPVSYTHLTLPTMFEV